MPDRSNDRLEPIAKFCASSGACCPELFIDHGAVPERRIVMIDDSGQRVQMSQEQLKAMVADIKNGALDGLASLAGPRPRTGR